MATKLPAFLTHLSNLAANGTGTITTTSDTSAYPIANITGLPISKAWRSATGVISNVDILIDFGSAQSINLLALINHNLTSTATIAVAAGTTTGVSNYSTTISYRQYDAFTYLSAAQSYRYWRIRITDSSSTDNFIEAGYLIAASATKLASTFQYGWTQADNFVNNAVTSEFGVPYIDELYYQQEFNFTFANKSQTEVNVMRTIFQAVKRNVTPIFFIPDTGTNDGYFGRFQNSFVQTVGVPASAGQGTNLITLATLNFLEDSRGRKIAA